MNTFAATGTNDLHEPQPTLKDMPSEWEMDGVVTQERMYTQQSFSWSAVWVHRFWTLINYLRCLVFGIMHDFLFNIRWWLSWMPAQIRTPFLDLLDKDTTAMYDLRISMVRGYDDYFNRWIFLRLHDVFSRPICSGPGAWIQVMNREFETNPAVNRRFFRGCWTLKLKKRVDEKTGSMVQDVTPALNLGSYNYLGFADNEESCQEDVIKVLERYGASTCSSCVDYGTTPVHRELEAKIAQFVGKEDAVAFAMGFATNSLNIPSIAGPGDLIVSDGLNHASIIIGCRSSGASIKVFRHNDMASLESVIRKSIVEGQPRTHRPWKRVIIFVEGIYSMEGGIVNFRDLVAIKKRYKCYLYVDEAHSIGAIGRTGRGICEYWGVNPDDVDILMGTFTKSFASIGGYIAGDRTVISHLRRSTWAVYGHTISPPAAQQIISALRVLTETSTGKQKLQRLKDNSNYFRTRLQELGFKVYGSPDSPIVPIMINNMGKMLSFSRECLSRHVAVVVVGAPATPFFEQRARFCISAGHTREDIDGALKVISEVGDIVMVKFCKRKASRTPFEPKPLLDAPDKTIDDSDHHIHWSGNGNRDVNESKLLAWT